MWVQGQREQSIFFGAVLPLKLVLAALSHTDPGCFHYRMRKNSRTQEGFVDLMPSEGFLHSSVIFPEFSPCPTQLCAGVPTPSTPGCKELRAEAGGKESNPRESSKAQGMKSGFPEPKTSCNEPHGQQKALSECPRGSVTPPKEPWEQRKSSPETCPGEVGSGPWNIPEDQSCPHRK